MARRKPANCCSVCGRSLEEVGGFRLVSTATYGVSVCTPKTPIGAIRHPARSIRLEGDFRDVIVAMFGDELWTNEAINRVREATQSGLRPWFCQRCAGRDLCPVCGTPMTAVPGADHMADDGSVSHMPYFYGMGKLRHCPDSDCSSNQKLSD